MTDTGEFVPQLSDLDNEMMSFMTQGQIAHGALAVTKDGRLEYARAFTFGGPAEPITQPDSLFRVASVSKPLTAIAIMQLIEDIPGITLETQLGQIPGFDSNGWVDPLLMTATLREVLQHRGGWDPDNTKNVVGMKQFPWMQFPIPVPEPGFDPMFRNNSISDELDIPLPISQNDIIQYMKTYFRSFDPGSSYAYSNFGYLLLGRVIEALSGQDYEDYIRHNVLCPVGAGGMKLGRTLIEHKIPGEVPYRHPFNAWSNNVMGASPSLRRSPYGGFNIENMDAHGGWVSSTVDMVRVATAFRDKTSSPLATEPSIDFMWDPTAQSGNGYCAGWQTWGSSRYHNGSLTGTWAYMVGRPDGVCFSVFFSQRHTGNIPSYGSILGDLQSAITGIESTGGWPGNDFFRRFDSDTSECPPTPGSGPKVFHSGQVPAPPRR